MTISDEEYEQLGLLAIRVAADGLRAGIRPAAITALLQVVAELPWRISQPDQAKARP